MSTHNNTPNTELKGDPTTEIIPPFFVTSIEKLVLMFIGTMGSYILYWGYKHWSTQRKILGKSIWPLWRTLFLPFYTHSLCRLIARRLEQQKLSTWNYSVIAAALVTLKLTELVIIAPDLLNQDPFSAKTSRKHEIKNNREHIHGRLHFFSLRT